MIFKRLHLYNYGPYLGKHDIDLTSNDNSAPITLIGALNGGGKTSILDALRLALYGQRAQCNARGNLPYKEYLRQSVNQYTPGPKMACVELTFLYKQQGIESEYRVRRTWHKNDKVNEVLYVEKDGEPDHKLQETWDETVEEIIPLGISNLFLFDGEQVGNLADQDETPQEVQSAIRSLLGFELIDRLERDLTVLVTRKKKEGAKGKVLQQLKEIEALLKSENAQLRTIDDEVEKLQEKVVAAKAKLEKAETLFRAEGGELGAARSELEKERAASKACVDAISSQLRELAAEVSPLALVGGLLSRAQIQAEKEANVSRYSPFVDALQERDQQLMEMVNSFGVKKPQIKKLLTFIESANSKHFAFDHELDCYLGADERIASRVNDVTEKVLPTAIKKISENQKELGSYLEEVERFDAKLVSAATPEDLDRLIGAVTEAKAELEAYNREYDQTWERKAERARAVEKLVSQTRTLLNQDSDLVAKRDLTKRILRESERVNATLKRFREKLTQAKIQFLEKTVTDCYRSLMRKEHFIGQVQIDPETFNLHVLDGKRKAIPKRRLSAGEKQLLAVAFLWGLAEASGRALPLVIDTPLGRLDSHHRANLVDRYFPKASHQVVILSTDTEINQEYVEKLRKSKSIANELILTYQEEINSSTVQEGYFW